MTSRTSLDNSVPHSFFDTIMARAVLITNLLKRTESLFSRKSAVILFILVLIFTTQLFMKWNILFEFGMLIIVALLDDIVLKISLCIAIIGFYSSINYLQIIKYYRNDGLEEALKTFGNYGTTS
ncbi:hypothetical protein VCUG_01430 [Vavraia culicis subsp. floridensis]|uniref:Uncharacterized protein n=1 Tax=Vavraia culicis (isolate floridensis) TaxID=948595 RepID=L2GTX2_VAVCU|nr:uncharacterized protein VCUG_01430 [Vavraia culicis subsp. floridensis]ELA47069.1 hypothetical protein VCUG_01430 [Vavraia culicis subsp. floridensis]